jgi:hypothetical protein
MALAQRCGLATLLADRLKIAAKGGANAAAKIVAAIAGMVCGADSITDLDCCGAAGCAGCSPGCARRRRWGVPAGCSPSATSASSTPSPPDY